MQGEWTRQAFRKAIEDQPAKIDAKLRAVIEASRHRFPTADIETMLQEIEAGRRLTSIHWRQLPFTGDLSLLSITSQPPLPGFPG